MLSCQSHLKETPQAVSAVCVYHRTRINNCILHIQKYTFIDAFRSYFLHLTENRGGMHRTLKKNLAMVQLLLTGIWTL